VVIANVTIWLWFTVLFANFAEALAEGRSKAQAAALRGLKQTVMAKKLAEAGIDPVSRASAPISCARATSCWWRRGTTYRAMRVIEGAASVDESAITGESRRRARVRRRFSSVTGGTRVLSDWNHRAHHANPGERSSIA